MHADQPIFLPGSANSALQPSTTTDTYKSSPHLLYLDAARGIAAWMVAFQHLLDLNSPAGKVLWFVFNGTAAVSFFFVLSGTVLAYKFLHEGQALDVRRFALTRFMRLFPGFAAAVLLHALYFFLRDGLTLAAVSRHMHEVPAVIAELVMLRPHAFYFPPGWTIPFEFAASLALPVLLILWRWSREALWWLVLFCLLTGSIIINPLFINFIFGVLIAAYLPQIQSAAFRQTRAYRYRHIAIAVSFVLCAVRQLNKLHPFGTAYERIMSYLNLDYYLFAGIGAAVFLIAILHSRRAQRLLANRLLLFCGKISFGIYLMHWMLMLMLQSGAAHINAWLPWPAAAITCTVLVYTAAIFVLATMLYYFIERPAIRLGKRWAARLHPALTIPPNK